jgi:hypothetical protein
LCATVVCVAAYLQLLTLQYAIYYFIILLFYYFIIEYAYAQVFKSIVYCLLSIVFINLENVVVASGQPSLSLLAQKALAQKAAKDHGIVEEIAPESRCDEYQSCVYGPSPTFI